MEVIGLESRFYPNSLRKLKRPPKELFVEGNAEILNSHSLSVIGSRTCTEYGERWCKRFVKDLVEYNLTIVSGLAVGIDGIAHRQALDSGGKTIAVLPCGLENIYPRENIKLFKQILKNGGAVITEYTSKTKAEYNKFLERNRIVSGLSIATLVIEAAYRSGTSVTAGFAKKQERDVYCLPRQSR